MIQAGSLIGLMWFEHEDISDSWLSELGLVESPENFGGRARESAYVSYSMVSWSWVQEKAYLTAYWNADD